MSVSVEKYGRTAREAIDLALKELNAGEDEVDIEIIEEGGSKGIFGLLGNKPAKVRVSVKESSAETAVKFLSDVFEKMGVSAKIDASEENDLIALNISGTNSGIIIGKRGETLDALQYLTSLVVNKCRKDYKKVTIDVEKYREKREESLGRLADRMAKRVIKYNRDVALEPMNPYERRIIHSSLQNNRFVETYSVGEGLNRKVVIALRRHSRSGRKE